MTRSWRACGVLCHPHIVDVSHDQLAQVSGGAACAVTVGAGATGGGLLAGKLSRFRPVRNGLISAAITGLVAHWVAPSCQKT